MHYSGDMQGGAEMPVLRFSTDQFPTRDRIPAWREFVGRTFCRIDIEPLSNDGFAGATTMRIMPGLGIITGNCSPLTYVQTRQLNDSDDVILTAASGAWELDYAGERAAFDAGDAVLTSAADACSFALHAGGPHWGLRLPLSLLSPHVRDIEDRFGRRIPAQSPALRLLRHHLGMIEDLQSPDMHELRPHAATQIRDLIAVAVGATRDSAEIAQARGVRAARLRAIKDDVRQSLGRADLSVATMGARHRLPIRYLQRLFESEGTTFTEFVLGERLARVHRTLTDTRFCDRAVSTIAFDAGFQHLSYFNRAFRARFGASPSDVRAQAQPRAEAASDPESAKERPRRAAAHWSPQDHTPSLTGVRPS
jgi:AraC-like DNA-binding protein